MVSTYEEQAVVESGWHGQRVGNFTIAKVVHLDFQHFTVAVKYLFLGSETLRTLAGTTADPAAEQTQAFQMRFLGGRLSSMPLIASWLCFAQPLLFASHRPAHGLASRSRPYSARYALYYSRQSTKSPLYRRVYTPTLSLFHFSQSRSGRSSCLLRLTLLLNQHLLSEHLLNHPQVVGLAVDHIRRWSSRRRSQCRRLRVRG
jgi:hypothetical protein